MDEKLTQLYLKFLASNFNILIACDNFNRQYIIRKQIDLKSTEEEVFSDEEKNKITEHIREINSYYDIKFID